MFGLFFFIFVFFMLMKGGIAIDIENAESRQKAINEDEAAKRQGKVPLGVYLDNKCRYRMINSGKQVFLWKDHMCKYGGQKNDMWILDAKDYRPIRNVSAERRANGEKQ